MRRRLMCAGLAVAVAGSAATAHAQGSSVITHSACATAMGAAGVASPCQDGSAILFNPAGLVMTPSVVSAGTSVIRAAGNFTYDFSGERIDRERSTTPVPFAYGSFRVSDRLAAGIGVFAPYGLGIDWPLEFEGRFASYDAGLKNIYIQPTVAFQLDPVLSVGAGLNVVRSSLEIQQRVDLATTALPAQPFPGRTLTFGNLGIASGTDFADARLGGDGMGIGFHLGTMLRLADNVSLGARYLSAVEVELEGTADFAPVPTGITLPARNPFNVPGGTPLDAVVAAAFQGPLADQDLSTSLELPAQLVVGVAFEPAASLKLLADFQWTGWSSFDAATIDFANSPDQLLILDYQDTQTYRLGGEFSPIAPLALRAGFIYNTAAEKEFSVSPLLPEAERNYYTAGIGFQFAPGLRLDLAYQQIDQAARRGRVRGRAPGLTETQLRALNVGVYEVDVDLFNATVAWQFGRRH